MRKTTSIPLTEFFFTIMFLCIAVIPPPAIAQVRGPSSKTYETILIKNVTLIDKEGKAEDVIVNILIKNNKLDVVTKDDLAPNTADLALDAQQGVLLGHLNPGQQPSFLILDKDPRKTLRYYWIQPPTRASP